MDIWMFVKLIGGLGLFLYGMKLMSEGLERTAGNKLRRGLEVLTTNRFAGAGVGLGVTALIQSSSATTVMVVGFVNAGLMTLMQASGVIMGANIGTTVTAWIITIPFKQIAPLFVFIGMVMMFFSKRRVLKRIGGIVLGFGILFVGMDMMSDAMKPLRDLEAFKTMVATFENPVIGILIGVAITVAIQSSSATTAILVSMATIGAISLPAAVYVIFGSNIGTCITAILASIGASKTAKRASVIHLLFNVVGVILFAIVIQFVPLVDWLVSTGFEVKTQIALFHTIFNVFALLAMIWYPQILIKISHLVVRGEDEAAKKSFKYIGEKILDTPSIAVGQAVREVGRMAELARENFVLSMESLHDLDEKKIKIVVEQEEVVNFLNHEITAYLAKLSALELTTNEALMVADLFHIVNDIERISDHAENITEYTNSRIDDKIPFTDDAVKEIKAMSGQVALAIENCVLAFENHDKERAKEVIRIEQVVDDYETELKNSHITRVSNGTCTPRAGMIFTDLVTDLERVADHATNIAYYVSKSEYK